MVLLVTFSKGLGTHNQPVNKAVFPFFSPLGTFRRRDSLKALGTLTKGNDDGSENVGKKMNLRSFKLNRVYLDPLNMSNTGDISWRGRKIRRRMFTSSIKRQIRRLHVVVVQ